MWNTFQVVCNHIYKSVNKILTFYFTHRRKMNFLFWQQKAIISWFTVLYFSWYSINSTLIKKSILLLVFIFKLKWIHNKKCANFTPTPDGNLYKKWYTLYSENKIIYVILTFFCVRKHRTIPKEYMIYQETKNLKHILNICISK